VRRIALATPLLAPDDPDIVAIASSPALWFNIAD
jgi:hypothetical protein